MPITIGTRPESDYGDPLGLLSGCHRRIERFLDLLVRVVRQTRGGKLDGEHREALGTALGYFKNAAPKHTLDEEESLFPRLRAAGSDASQAFELLDGLHNDHQRAEEMHQEVERLVEGWLAEETLSKEMSERLSGLLDDLEAIYQRHIAIEDQQLFPLASRVLPRTEIDQIGREMAARRGITFDRL